MREFERYNPYIILLHFILIIGICMLILHPAVQLTALLSGVIYLIIRKGKKALKTEILASSFMILVTALVNPAFNHRGETVLLYLPTGNPLTAESLFFGLISGLMLGSVICWFSCFNNVFKSDKILYVFGRFAPSLSLAVSMTIRFVPDFIRRAKEIIEVQKTLGRDLGKGSLSCRVHLAGEILSAVVTKSLESSVDTAVSMRARGFGTGKRTAYSRFSFTKDDLVLLILDVVLVGMFLCNMGSFRYNYYPNLDFSFDLVCILVYVGICFMPIVSDIMEGKKWS